MTSPRTPPVVAVSIGSPVSVVEPAAKSSLITTSSHAQARFRTEGYSQFDRVSQLQKASSERRLPNSFEVPLEGLVALRNHSSSRENSCYFRALRGPAITPGMDSARGRE
ncbi:hypothetical protein CEE69_04875 [Rhodopirellula bahusiensis]|uniref:Uncharacterized protein n=1 Tax=Rhodopirellula bahusiensis TaxID=2014065 RepID=A0A2G1WCD3_9BACT|nr:hypothetical protein CEE69_04875 [Rhodopirellula bahusiensis]